ncbi:hypothetical protein EI94DRAFT_1701985 [Lactarius quietus]|nr:hypothetical protein EI94DRAFT_1701985 [Lactarius quietus]
MQGFIMDGNFQAEHMKMRYLENDIPLFEGRGFMVSWKPYELHLQSALERQQHAFMGLLYPIWLSTFKREKHEFSNILIYACQNNMDYLIFMALNFNMEGIEATLIFYDVMCQWSVHMMRRVNGSHYLKLPDNLKLRPVIGLFHIHGHQDTCLARYSPSFIKGRLQIDRETIETLLAPLNEITRSQRGMSMSHCWEVIDDHMNHSNWKKLVNLVNAVSRHYQKAVAGVI